MLLLASGDGSPVTSASHPQQQHAAGAPAIEHCSLMRCGVWRYRSDAAWTMVGSSAVAAFLDRCGRKPKREYAFRSA